MRRRIMYLARTVEPLRPYGYGPGRGHKSPKNRGKVYAKGGNRNKYLVARIARDHPEVLERMKRGEFTTVQAAAIEAGIVKSKVSGPTTSRERPYTMGKKRGNNEGTIFRRKDGRWVAQLTTGRDPKTGKLKRTVVYGKTRKEVAAKLVQDQQELNRGTFVASNKLTLGDWLDTWLVTYKQNQVRSITYDTYEMIVRRHLKPALGHIRLRELRPELIQQYYNDKLQDGLGADTIGHHRKVLSNALSQAEKNQLVANNVCRLADSPRCTRKEMQTLTRDQINTQLLPALQHERIGAAVYLVFATDLRRGELLGLRWIDINLETAVLQVRRTVGRVKDHDTGRTHLVIGEPKTPAL